MQKPKLKKKKKAKKILTPKEIEKRRHRKEIRSIFLNSNFKRINSEGKKLKFENREGEFDDIFLLENVIVLAEYTTDQDSDHLKLKKILFDKILNNSSDFIEYLDGEIPELKQERKGVYAYKHCKVVILYCSLPTISEDTKKLTPGVTFLDYPLVKYFEKVTKAIKLSSRFELFHFFGLRNKEIGENILKPNTSDHKYQGLILPEAHSGFGKGYKVVSFYADPESLLEMTYVLRRDGWQNNSKPYQRLIISNKIADIRKYLKKSERVFINNVIVTLPNKTKILDENDDTVQLSNYNSVEPVNIKIPNEFSSIGLIDGQHRIFAYHEGKPDDDKIQKLRKTMNLLVTGIIYPSHVKEIDKRKFEARLFLEINSNQKSAANALKQEIISITDPFSPEGVARYLLSKLTTKSALGNVFEYYFYEKKKVKTTSVVSYGLKPLIKFSGEDSFYSLWNNSNKSELLEKKDEILLEKYITFAAQELDIFFGAVKNAIPKERWTSDNKIKDKVLNTTFINGFIICFRKLIENGKTGDFEYYKKKFEGLDTFIFSKYKSSAGYGQMGIDLYDEYFK